MRPPVIEWRPIWDVWVDGEPKAQPRHRCGKRGFRCAAYMPDTADVWKARVAHAFYEAGARARQCGDGPLRLEMDVFFPRPDYMKAKKWPDGPIPHHAKPDWDNVGKAISDALVSWNIGPFTAHAVPDDACFAQAEVRKWWQAKAGRPGAQIRILAVDLAPIQQVPIVRQMTPSEARTLIEKRRTHAPGAEA